MWCHVQYLVLRMKWWLQALVHILHRYIKSDTVWATTVHFSNVWGWPLNWSGEATPPNACMSVRARGLPTIEIIITCFSIGLVCYKCQTCIHYTGLLDRLAQELVRSCHSYMFMGACTETTISYKFILGFTLSLKKSWHRSSSLINL